MTGQPRQRETRRRAETRRRLIDAAREVFAEHSIRDTPVELICETAGYSRGAFYSNFDTKEDLFLAVYEEEMALRIERTRAIVEDVIALGIENERDLHEAMVKVGTACAESLIADQNWYLLVTEFRAHALRDPQLRERAGGHLEKLTDAVAGLMLDALERLDLRLVVDARDAVRALTSLYEAELERTAFTGVQTTTQSPLFTEVFPSMVRSFIEPRG
ncbi:TetR/AcrR family transcriptional regulator [Saccharopolyspora halophila]|uniref:TetR/AcrR family transcriptional regulator n=1 Tax=Saccharopolyspora halophila TaxID=405551 RepID=A0ABN3FSS3_9PSEU